MKAHVEWTPEEYKKDCVCDTLHEAMQYMQEHFLNKLSFQFARYDIYHVIYVFYGPLELGTITLIEQ